MAMGAGGMCSRRPCEAQCCGDAVHMVCSTAGTPSSPWGDGVEWSLGQLRAVGSLGSITQLCHVVTADGRELGKGRGVGRAPLGAGGLVLRWGSTWQGTARSSDRSPNPAGSNNECEMFVCNCDRTAAMCFSKAPYDPAHHRLDKKKYCSS